ncbi:hypothetical protein K402DRAFT_100128 [Aulographum hederae CBS 113979]|uniref:Uncharacterized protein n=1 Tax=Aulographum hederae CBS 113979 TaxID=1176131 RepID=A0A6G1GXV8_9PEZI|nr:hypothetical protein K402DRAFT_100128 [Aulographum hederae CBS 113979]
MKMKAIMGVGDSKIGLFGCSSKAGFPLNLKLSAFQSKYLTRRCFWLVVCYGISTVCLKKGEFFLRLKTMPGGQGLQADTGKLSVIRLTTRDAPSTRALRCQIYVSKLAFRRFSLRQRFSYNESGLPVTHNSPSTEYT